VGIIGMGFLRDLLALNGRMLSLQLGFVVRHWRTILMIWIVLFAYGYANNGQWHLALVSAIVFVAAWRLLHRR
jgi:hypothetical protein